MATITAEQVKKLESKMDDVLKKLEKHAAEIIQDKDNLMNQIFDFELRLKDCENKKNVIVAAGKDIYNIDSIAEAESGRSAEELKRKISLGYKAYSLNPYFDSERAREATELLDQLEEVAKELDAYYDGKVASIASTLKQAKTDLKEAEKQRTEYRRSVFCAQGMLRNAIGHDKIGYNNLSAHGADRVSVPLLFTCLSTVYGGQAICSGLKDAIQHEQEDAKRLQQATVVNETKEPFQSSNLIPGEPAVLVDTKLGTWNPFKRK